MRLMGLLFLCLTFLAGVTVGTVEIALVNIIVFLALALMADRFLVPRFGRNGLVYGMAGAFFVSCLWPAVIHGAKDDLTCKGEDCPPEEPEMTVTLSPA
ncbi:hypothetical protein [Erythrobacter sp. R86502]|uniref:hypothetical protein n=1 Tax=Erythrobacter sp. R86502 TaxID=3093846 RepID=UPI0036D311D2